MKIHKKKVGRASFAERLKKKAAFFDKLTLESVFDFGQYKGLNVYFTCQTNPEYVKWAVDSGIIMLDLQASKFLLQCLTVYRTQKAREQARERTRRAQAERERARRSDEEDARAYNEYFHNNREQYNSRFNQQRQQSQPQSSSVTNEKIHPAYQFDHLPDRVKYGKILRLEGKVTKEYIKSQYRKLALTFHPDKRTQDDEIMQETSRVMFVRVQQAYEYFKREYDL